MPGLNLTEHPSDLVQISGVDFETVLGIGLGYLQIYPDPSLVV